MLDSMLLQRFPGKTLEDLDLVNWPRLMRAMAAGEAERIEQLIELQRTGKATPTQREWIAIAEHDRLWNAARGSGR
ncbi:MAG: hypothetical protein IPM07_26325 [Anaerolineales bacterium]|nr:hypothetical protein [Anaerolineales bacterium]